MKLKIYSKGTGIIEEFDIEDDIQQDETGSFLCFTTVTGKKIITNMDFLVVDEEENDVPV